MDRETKMSYVSLLRVPAISFLALAGFPFLAIFVFKSLLGGLFDLSSGGHTWPRMFFVSSLAFTAAWTIKELFWLIVREGPRRFSVPQLLTSKQEWTALFALSAFPTIGFAAYESTHHGNGSCWTLLFAAIVGFVAALFVLDFAIAWASDKAGIHVTRLGRARAFLVIFLLLYAGIGITKLWHFGVQPIVPTLAYVLILLTFLCWMFSLLTFYFDKYRVPIWLIALPFVVLSGLLIHGDYQYSLSARQDATPISPKDAIRAGNGKRSSVIVVAATGGGIQAAAWTATVLTGLEAKSHQEKLEFARNIRFISAVSGGSVGTMYFVNAYTSDGLPNPELRGIVDRAEDSSLDDVAWGLLYPDLARVILPIDWKYDRGVALERALTRDTQNHSLSLTLGEWRDGVRQGWRPATVFNATVAETGDRLLFPTSDLESGRPGRMSFYDFSPNSDLKIVTAARLSSTFPYVSPASRAEPPGKGYHVVDGGYSDNYGIATLVEWLDSALDGTDNPIKRVLIVQIRDAPPGSMREPKKRGWFYQSYVPLSAMLNVRNSGQFSHNEQEIDLLKRLHLKNSVSVESVVFQFCGADPPLSWYLTETQKEELRDRWKEQSSSRNWQIVKNFLSGGPPIISAHDDKPCDAGNGS